MLTPRFEVNQTEISIIITILAPYTNIQKTEIQVLEDDVRFYSAPYYLRLTLPGKVKEGPNSSAEYLADRKSYVITLDKIVPGEVFPNLNMLTVMLQPKGQKASSSKPVIELISSSSYDDSSESFEIAGDEWFIEQKMEEVLPTQKLLQQYSYGFGTNHNGLGTKYEIELAEVTEISNPDCLSFLQRSVLQEETENHKFSDDHYFQDLMVTDLSSILNYKLKLSTFQELTKLDRDQLKNFVNQEFIFDKKEQIRLYLGVVDIIFAFLYDLRINEGKSCVESQWNISRLSSTLCYFQVFDNMDDMIRSGIRRSLSCPLYRHWDLSMKVLWDTHKIISTGNLAILKCFLSVHKLFKCKDPFYLLNQLYINEYCVWIQHSSTENWNSLAAGLQKSIINVKKENIGFDLYYLEIAAKSTMDEAMEEEMSEQISGIMIG